MNRPMCRISAFADTGVCRWESCEQTAAAAPETAENGLWFCYQLQVWIRDRIILPCAHAERGLARMGIAQAGCYACAHAGETHAACAQCH